LLSNSSDENPASIEDLLTFFDDGNNQQLIELGKQSINPEISRFFHHQFHDKSYQPSKSALNKRLSSLLQSDAIRSFLCGRSTINLEKALNSGKIIICNLSSSELTDEIAGCIGRFLVSMIKLAAFNRATIPEKKRPINYLLIDEFPVFFSASQSSKPILEQARKFGLHLFASMQELNQLERSLKASLLNNSNLKIIGYGSATSLKESSIDINAPVSLLQGMKKYHFMVKKERDPPQIVLPPSVLVHVDSSNKYYRLHDAMKGILIDQIAQYYKKWSYGQRVERLVSSLPRPTSGDQYNNQHIVRKRTIDDGGLQHTIQGNPNSNSQEEQQEQEPLKSKYL
jgi:hypothetical protein